MKQPVVDSPSAVKGSFVPIGKPCSLMSLKYNHQAGSGGTGAILFISGISRNASDDILTSESRLARRRYDCRLITPEEYLP